MPEIQPKKPQNLNPFASELLESLAGHAESAEIVLGGGVADGTSFKCAGFC